MFSLDNSLLSPQSLMALGLPAVIVQAVTPKLVSFMHRYPSIARLLPYVLALLSAMGAISYGIKPLWEKLKTFVWSWLPELEIQSDDPLYRYLNKFVTSKVVHTVPNKWLVSSTGRKDRDSYESDEEEPEPEEDSHIETEGDAESDIIYDNPSSRIFFHKGTLFSMQTPSPGNDYGQAISIRAFAPSYKSLHALLQESWSTYRTQAVERSTEVLEPQYNRWSTRKYKLIRKLSTVNIDEGSKTKIISDVARYLSPATKSWYRKRGIPHRRGYLFHGPPGTGKSSLAAAIAGHFHAKLYTLSLTDKNMSDSNLLGLMTSVEKGSVILLEDIDSSGIDREDPDTFISSRSCVTLSGLLNAIDGAAAPEGHILIMSTNAPGALDPALVRAGRVDFEIEFKNAGPAAAADIFIRMMDDDEDNDEKKQILIEKAQIFAQQIPDGDFSPAEIQGYLLDHARDVEGALKNVQSWIAEITAKRASAKDAAEAARIAKNKEAEDRKKQMELFERRNELEQQALEKREAAVAKLEELEQKTKEMTLQAEKLRAEAEIAKYQTGKGKLGSEKLPPTAPMSPVESDTESVASEDAGETKKAE